MKLVTLMALLGCTSATMTQEEYQKILKLYINETEETPESHIETLKK